MISRPLTTALKLLAPVVALVLSAGFALAADEEAKPAAKAERPAVDVPFHGNELCPLMGKPVKPNKFVEKDGERVYVCCSKCRKKLKTDFAAQREKAYPADQIIDLKNTHCPIMGGEVDGETSMVFQNYQIQLCCPGCDRKFKKNPRKYLTLLLNPDLVALDNEQCPVMPEEPAEMDNFFVYDGVIIDTCCSDCPEMFQEEPARYLKEAGLDLVAVKAKAKAEKSEDG